MYSIINPFMSGQFPAPFAQGSVREPLDLLAAQLLMARLLGHATRLIRGRAVAAVRSERLRRGEGLPAGGAGAAVALPQLVARLPLPRPGPAPDAQVLLVAAAALAGLRGALQRVA